MASTIADDIASGIATLAKGLGCHLRDVPPALGRGLETELLDGDDALLELLSYVALRSARRRFHTRQGRLPRALNIDLGLPIERQSPTAGFPTAACATSDARDVLLGRTSAAM